MKTFEGKLVSQNIKVGIVAARFNEFIRTTHGGYTFVLEGCTALLEELRYQR